MRGKRIKQINNLVITLGLDNEYMVWSPNNTILYGTRVLGNAEQFCIKNKDFLVKKGKVCLPQKPDNNMFYRRNNIIQLCHGSQNIIKKPYYGGGESTNDYGSGFYTVSAKNRELAKEWACSIYNKTGTAYVNDYELNTTGLNILNLDKYEIIYWITLTATCRQIAISPEVLNKLQEKYLIDISGYDCIYGWRCDDTFSKIINGFISENFTVEAVKEAVHLGCLQEQFVLISERAYNQITFKGAEEIKNMREYNKRFVCRKNDADNKINACRRNNRNGLYLGDFI